MKLNVIITGASGMVGKGVLLECLDSPQIDSVLILNRKPINVQHAKLKEIIVKDFFDLSSIENEISGYNACFFCLGTSSIGKSETDYRKITYDLTLYVAQSLLKQNQEFSFCYVSGAGTNSESKTMWSHVKGTTENDLLKLPFKSTFMFRPGYIQPLRGTKIGVVALRIIHFILSPLYPLLKLFPGVFTDTVKIGQAMINVILNGYEKKYLENKDIHLASKA